MPYALEIILHNIQDFTGGWMGGGGGGGTEHATFNGVSSISAESGLFCLRELSTFVCVVCVCMCVCVWGGGGAVRIQKQPRTQKTN